MRDSTVPTNALLLALAAGLISAVVFASATTGPMVLRVVLFFLTPLSLYLAGLGLGHAAAAAAALVAGLLIMLIAGPAAAMFYAVSAAIPAVVITRLALLSRETESGQEWYPIGRLVAAAALFGGVLAALVLAIMGGDVDTLTKTMRAVVDSFVKSELANMPGAPKFDEAQITDMAQTTLAALPLVLGGLGMATALVNLWLAGRITQASGRLVRPWPDLTTLTLPSGLLLILCIVLAVKLAGGVASLYAGGFTGPITIAFALVGLAVIHALTRQSPWRSLGLWALYAALLVFTQPLLLLLAIGGVAETVFNYRGQYARDGDGRPPPV